MRRVVHQLASVVKNHRRMIFVVVRFPLRQARVIRVAAFHEGVPRAHHLILQGVTIGTFTGDAFGDIDVAERERNADGVRRFEQAMRSSDEAL